MKNGTSKLSVLISINPYFNNSFSWFPTNTLVLKIIRNVTNIPIAVGFGIRTPENAVNIARSADAVVVGSAIIDKIYDAYKEDKNNIKLMTETVSNLVKSLSKAIKNDSKYKI